MTSSPSTGSRPGKRPPPWVVVLIVTAVVGLAVWLLGRSKDPRFSVDAIKRRLFGSGGQG